MKVYSDSLTRSDLQDAARRARVGIDRLEDITRARVRRHGWKVQLTGSSRQARNTGMYGGDSGGSSPATWSEHGHWMAFLFAIDPEARIAYYEGAVAFHAQTEGAFTA